jgi:hypothetical protein
MLLNIRFVHIVPAAVLSIAFVPSSASALTFLQVIGLFHIAVGLLLTATLLVFITGVGVYVSRLNTWPSHRDMAIRVMEWGIVMLFVLILMLALLDFFQNHTAIALPILAVLILVTVGFLLVRAAALQRKKKAASAGARPARPAR